MSRTILASSVTAPEPVNERAGSPAFGPRYAGDVSALAVSASYSEPAQMKFEDGSPLLGQHEMAVHNLKIAAELVGLAYAQMPGGEKMDGTAAMTKFPAVVAAVFRKLAE